MEIYSTRREQYKHLIVFCANALTLILEVLPFAWFWYRVAFPLMRNPFAGMGSLAMVLIYALILFLFTRALNGYNISSMRTYEAVVSNLLALFCTNLVAYVLVGLVTVNYFNIPLIIGLTVLEMAVLALWVVLVRYVFTALYPPHTMIVVWSDFDPSEIIEKLVLRRDRYDVCETISLSQGYEKVEEQILKYEAVLLYNLEAKERNDMLKFCYDHSIRTYLTPKISDILISGMEGIYLFDTPLYLARNMGLTPLQRFWKRLTDIVVSAIGLVIASPFMLLIAIAIKLCDGGPVFYRQTRLTRNGREFRIYKFRSMYVDSEKSGARLASKHDSRVTPVGKVIRNLHFDELPQLINVLKGEMSIVGPRPERPEIVEEYQASIPEYSFRIRVKAGITGYAQVYGRYNTEPIDKLKYDMMYIQHYSLSLDFKIMLLTFKILFQKENAEGVDDSKRTAIK